jgi:hypothetical protein
MRGWMIVAGMVGAAVFCEPHYALSADHEAGVPLVPAEAGGAWTLESGGHSVCVLTLGRDKTVKAPAACAPDLTGNPTSWQPTTDGMQFIGADGQSLIAFSRWSNSLFVSHRSSGVDIQLRRGRPRS